MLTPISGHSKQTRFCIVNYRAACGSYPRKVVISFLGSIPIYARELEITIGLKGVEASWAYYYFAGEFFDATLRH